MSLSDQPPAEPATVVRFLQSEAAAAVLAQLACGNADEVESPALVARLRKSFSPWQASALLVQARLRRRAAAKWPFAARLMLVEEALEQATAWPVALYRAARLHGLAPPGDVLEVGCGIGGDTMALATLRPLSAWEQDPTRAAFARANLAALAAAPQAPPLQPATIHTGDWNDALAGAHPPFAAAFVDPARRTVDSSGAARRVFSLQTMTPPLSALLPLLRTTPLLVVKVAPGLAAAEVPHGAALQFVSHDGTAKEGVLWMGEAASSLPRRWAGVYDGARWHEMEAGGAAAPSLASNEAPEPGMLLWEPDPAVVRAGALDTLCARFGARLFAPDIAYLLGAGGTEPPPTPFAAAFRLLEAAPFSLKRLNERLRALGAGSAELKKRGFPQEPESLRKRLRLTPGGRPLVVLLTRRGATHWMLLAERLPAAPRYNQEKP